MGESPCYFEAVVDGPVESISWEQAVDFCNALSLREGKTPPM